MAKYLNGSDPDLYPNINWMDEIYKNSTTSERVNINVTGGSEKVKYYVAGSYYKENGVFRPDKGLGYQFVQKYGIEHQSVQSIRCEEAA